MPTILVTGGCGYIGSHTLVDLINNGYQVVSIDNLVNSRESVLDGVEQITGVRVVNYAYNLCDMDKVRTVFEQHRDIEGIIHFAALKSVMESVTDPINYFDNNVNSLLNVLRCMDEFGVHRFIFSSSCSVYGNTKQLPVTEDTPLEEAESPYARTKQIGEMIIQDFAKASPQHQFVLLRYFNPAGAHPSAIIGERSLKPAIYLVPVICEVGIGKRASMTVFGNTYPTRDGSCIRDFIHIMDLADAHTKCLQYLESKKAGRNCEVFNVGIGAGVSVLEAIEAFERVSGTRLNYTIGAPRAGDVVAIYANYTKAAAQMGWQPKYSIDDIMHSAWAWEQRMSTH
jgi:UDP-glucose 4-epimerase